MTAKWDHGSLNSNGIQIHYYRTGGNKPQVVLNHGALDDGLCWTRVAKALQADYDLIMLDTRGHGRSKSGQGDYTSQSRAADVANAIRVLGLDRPVVGGHSLGADATLHLAATYPNLTRGIFLEDPPITLPGQPIFEGKLTGNMDPTKLMRAYMRIIRVLPGFISRPLARILNSGYPDDDVLPWLESKKRCSMDFLNNLSTCLDFGDGIPTELFSRIDVPVLLFIGDRDSGSIVSKAVAEKIQATTKDLRIIHFAGAGHDIHRARFEDYLCALRDFLAETYPQT